MHLILHITVVVLFITFLASPYFIAQDAKTRFGYSIFGGAIKYVYLIAGHLLWIGYFWIDFAKKNNIVDTEIFSWGVIALGIAGFGYVLYKNIMGTDLKYGLASSLVMIPAVMLLSGLFVPVWITWGFVRLIVSGASIQSGSPNNDQPIVLDPDTDLFNPPGTILPYGSYGQVIGEEHK